MERTKNNREREESEVETSRRRRITETVKGIVKKERKTREK
jgi:hypothetical protein